MTKAAAVVLVNVVVLAFLIMLLDLAGIVGTLAYYEWFGPLQYFADAYLLPNYQGAEWARKHFLEFNELEATYTSYYGWRRLPYAGDTIHIDDRGLRRTYRDQTATSERTVAFFGGSTMWGSGADDDRTIPSEFTKLNPEYVGYNFGESGYVAHQSVNLFLKRYFEGFQPDVVVFYDGANEVWAKCQYQLGPYSHWQEAEIRTMLLDARAARVGRGASIIEITLELVRPFTSFLEKLGRKVVEVPGAKYYDCDRNPEKAAQIARVLLSDWLLVKNLVESYGGTFIAALQPVIYFSKTKTDHLDLDGELGKQYKTVYPIIIDMMEREFQELNGNFMDLRHAFDRDEYIYIDWCHVSPNGNQIIAQRISERIAVLTGKAVAQH